MECEERRTLKRVHELEMLIHDLVVAHGLLEGELIEKNYSRSCSKNSLHFHAIVRLQDLQGGVLALRPLKKEINRWAAVRRVFEHTPVHHARRGLTHL
jgi:hypothetical protein